MLHAQTNNTKIMLSGKTSGQITLGEIAGQQLLPENNDGAVESFTVVIGNDQAAESVHVIGSFVNKTVSNKLRTLPEGTAVTFTNIMCASTSGTVQKMPDLIFTIVKD